MENRNVEYLIIIVVTIIVVWLISFVLRRLLDFFIKRSSKKLRVDPTNFIFLKNSITFVCVGIGFFWIFSKIPYFKSLGTALFASAGVIAAIIGFASQKAFSNIIGGIFLLIFKPFRVGDAIEISTGQKGVVEEITLRHTVIKDYEFRRIIIPNSIMSEGTVINSTITDEKIRKHIDIGIAYDTNIDKAMDVIRTVIERNPLCLDNRTKEDLDTGEMKVPIRVINLGDFSIELRAFVWTRDFDSAILLRCEVLKEIKEAFDSEGIEIPFPYRTIVYKNDLIDQNENSRTKE